MVIVLYFLNKGCWESSIGDFSDIEYWVLELSESSSTIFKDAYSWHWFTIANLFRASLFRHSGERHRGSLEAAGSHSCSAAIAGRRDAL